MSKRYVVTLAEDERAALRQRVSSGRGSARELARARVLLKADGGPSGPAWSDAAVAAALDVGVSTDEQVRGVSLDAQEERIHAYRTMCPAGRDLNRCRSAASTRMGRRERRFTPHV